MSSGASDAAGFELAIEIDKQIIAISTAVLTLTAVFFQTPASLNDCERWLLGVSWTLFGLAVVAGLIVFMYATGALTRGRTAAALPKEKRFRHLSGCQIILFLLAVLLMLAFALARLVTRHAG